MAALRARCAPATYAARRASVCGVGYDTWVRRSRPLAHDLRVREIMSGIVSVGTCKMSDTVLAWIRGD